MEGCVVISVNEFCIDIKKEEALHMFYQEFGKKMFLPTSIWFA